MKEEEYITTYFLRVDEIVDSMKGLGETIEINSIGNKILRTIPPLFNSKVSVLEDSANLDKVTNGEFHRILTYNEMRIKNYNVSIRP